MATILNIDTSGDKGTLAIGKNGICLQHIDNYEPMQHASFLQPGIVQLLKDCNMQASELDAIAVSNGPGSYTGLRVGLASAKGLCFAWQKPLITISSLRVMATSACQYLSNTEAGQKLTTGDVIQKISTSTTTYSNKSFPVWYCPMTDARRMEVFFALYNDKLEEVLPAGTAILTEEFLQEYLENNCIVFVGTGTEKWKAICHNRNALFITDPLPGNALCLLAEKEFLVSNFDTLDTAEPFYAKEFHSTQPLSRL